MVTRSLPSDRFPRVIGFEIPSTLPNGELPPHDPPLAMLDCQPADEWIRLFLERSALLRGTYGLTDIHIESGVIRFVGTSKVDRLFTAAVSTLVDGTSAARLAMQLERTMEDVHLDGAGI